MIPPYHPASKYRFLAELGRQARVKNDHIHHPASKYRFLAELGRQARVKNDHIHHPASKYRFLAELGRQARVKNDHIHHPASEYRFLAPLGMTGAFFYYWEGEGKTAARDRAAVFPFFPFYISALSFRTETL